jgi:hypothetical protein
MKRIPPVLFVGFLLTTVAASQASGGSRPMLGQVSPEALPPHSSKPHISTAQVPPGEVEEQVPVKEQVEPIDSPAANMASGNAEAQTPAVESPPSSQGEEPSAEQPPNVQQPAVEP